MQTLLLICLLQPCKMFEHDAHAPMKTKSVKGKPADWLQGYIRRLMVDRDRLLRKARKSKLDSDCCFYKRARNYCNGKIRESKCKYYKNLIEENKSNPRKFWDAIKTIFPTKSKASLSPMNKGKSEKLANVFSDYFTNIVSKLIATYS